MQSINLPDFGEPIFKNGYYKKKKYIQPTSSRQKQSPNLMKSNNSNIVKDLKTVEEIRISEMTLPSWHVMDERKSHHENLECTEISNPTGKGLYGHRESFDKYSYKDLDSTRRIERDMNHLKSNSASDSIQSVASEQSIVSDSEHPYMPYKVKTSSRDMRWKSCPRSDTLESSFKNTGGSGLTVDMIKNTDSCSMYRDPRRLRQTESKNIVVLKKRDKHEMKNGSKATYRSGHSHIDHTLYSTSTPCVTLASNCEDGSCYNSYEALPENMHFHRTCESQQELVIPENGIQTMLPSTLQTNHESIHSRSILTCNRNFKEKFENVYLGLCKGIVDMNRLIQQEIIIPVRENIAVQRTAIRSRRAITGILVTSLSKNIAGKFPDVGVASKLVKKIANHFYNSIERAIKEAENERTMLEWLLRFDVENAVNIDLSTTFCDNVNTTYASVEGCAYIARRKGDIMSLTVSDTVYIDVELTIKVIFINGNQLKEINDDTRLAHSVQSQPTFIAPQAIKY